MADLSRRELLERFGGALVAVGLGPSVLGVVFSGCSPSKGSANSGGTGGGGGGGGNTTTVFAALSTASGGNVATKSTTNGNKITRAGSANGENIVFTVNGRRNDTIAPGSYNVRTGDVVDFFDLQNGSRYSFVVS